MLQGQADTGGLQKGQESSGEGGDSLCQTSEPGPPVFSYFKVIFTELSAGQTKHMCRTKLAFSYQSVIPGSFRNFRILSVGANNST